jgi:hypothetical protein
MPPHPQRNPAPPADRMLEDGADGLAGLFPDRDTCKHGDGRLCYLAVGAANWPTSTTSARG